MHQGCLLEIILIHHQQKNLCNIYININLTKKEYLKLKTTSKKEGAESENTNLSRFRESMSKDQIRASDILEQPGCNNWLDIISNEDFNCTQNKQQLLDTRCLYQVQHVVLVAKSLIHNIQCCARKDGV